ncbi:hypothetical protein L1987_85083 [Smallanthus sonchifolius]|uniref:Uncharacterized protein n=1 Tax=Smallanthus sonchifolius TaxID=185202 RepID=A0ACB8XW71_9ASTR|nr:hypothetical protein L1987_85083 [Smallanthus sonchifolius]
MFVNQTIKDGQTIVSPQQNFELGFFSPGNASENRYLGIWFKQLATGTILWVANRETAIKSKSGELRFSSDGVLVLRDSSTNRVVWSSNTNGKARNPVARLLDSGNFMVTDSNDNEMENYIWQSFDYPGDTSIPGMKPKVRTNSIYRVKFVSNDKEFYATSELINNFVLTKLTLIPEGNVSRFSWINRTQGWFLLSSPTSDSCVQYSLCGPYGRCEIEQSPPCKCLKGFTPKIPDQWDYGDWKSGCQREIPLDCGVGEGFRKYPFVKLPDTRGSWFDGYDVRKIHSCRNIMLDHQEAKMEGTRYLQYLMFTPFSAVYASLLFIDVRSA